MTHCTGNPESECSHEWKRAGPVVTPIGLPALMGIPSEQLPTYNAVCAKCDAKAWLHWPVIEYER